MSACAAGKAASGITVLAGIEPGRLLNAP